MQDSRINHTISMIIADRGDIDQQVETLRQIMSELHPWDDDRAHINLAISSLCQAKHWLTDAERRLKKIAVPMEQQHHG